MEGVIAVVGITIQLADTLQKLIKFWKEVQHAPDEVAALFYDVEILSALLARSRPSNENDSFDEFAENLLSNCALKVSALHARISRATSGLASCSSRKRKWSAFKISLDKADIVELRTEIKTSMSLLTVINLASFE